MVDLSTTWNEPVLSIYRRVMYSRQHGIRRLISINGRLMNFQEFYTFLSKEFHLKTKGQLRVNATGAPSIVPPILYGIKLKRASIAP